MLSALSLRSTSRMFPRASFFVTLLFSNGSVAIVICKPSSIAYSFFCSLPSGNSVLITLSIPSPFENMRASTASHAENKCSTYTRYASALFSAVSLYLLRLFSKGFVFPLHIVSGKTSGKVFLFNKQFSLADCCILFTITIKKTKCSTALSAPIFLPLLFCSRGVFPLNRFKNRRCIIYAAKRISASIAVRNTTVPISVYSSHTAVTHSVRK